MALSGVTTVRESTIAATGYGGAIGQRYPSSASQYLSLPLQYDLKRNWRTVREGIKVRKARTLGVRANAKATWEGNVRPFKASLSEKDYYLDEQDVVTFLDPPKELIPLDPSSYNPASYLWKKIEDIPEERRPHLLSLLNSRLRTRAWQAAGRRYDDPKLMEKSASTLLSGEDCTDSLELWICRTSGAPLQIAWINSTQKAIFGCTDGKTYGRFIGGFPLSGIINSIPGFYFSVKHVNEVMSTEQPCDFAYEFGNGLLDLPEYPQGFPKPSKHPWPLNDEVVIYIRHLGPGVMVGQAWQEGIAVQQVPKKLCNEILMVKMTVSDGQK